MIKERNAEPLISNWLVSKTIYITFKPEEVTMWGWKSVLYIYTLVPKCYIGANINIQDLTEQGVTILASFLSLNTILKGCKHADHLSLYVFQM